MDVIRKQEVLPALPKLDSFEPKLFCDRTRHSSVSGTESWRENLRYLADSIPDRGKLSHRDSNVLLNRQGTQNLSQRSSISSEHKMEELSRNIDLSRVLSEHSVSPWSKANIDCMHDVHPTDKDGERRGNGSKRNIVHEDSELSFPSKLPSFQTLNAIGGQKEEILSHQGRCFAPEAATKTAGICSPPTVDRNGKYYCLMTVLFTKLALW